MTDLLENCSLCHQPILAQYYFCPNCGHNLREKQIPISVALKLGLYALAIFLPPLGFWPGFKYAFKADRSAKRLGWIIILFTLLSSIIMTWEIFSLFNSYLSQISQLTS